MIVLCVRERLSHTLPTSWRVIISNEHAEGGMWGALREWETPGVFSLGSVLLSRVHYSFNLHVKSLTLALLFSLCDAEGEPEEVKCYTRCTWDAHGSENERKCWLVGVQAWRWISSNNPILHLSLRGNFVSVYPWEDKLWLWQLWTYRKIVQSVCDKTSSWQILLLLFSC